MATLYSDETVARARELHAAGMRTADIAGEIGTHPDTIRNWVNGTRGDVAKTRIVLTPAEVREIRHLRAVGGLSQRELAARFKTTQGAISRVTRGAAYKDVGGYKLAPKARDRSRKLSDADVRKLRELRATHPGTRGVKRLARRFNVSRALVYHVVARTMRPGLEAAEAPKETRR
jgi:transposase